MTITTSGAEVWKALDVRRYRDRLAKFTTGTSRTPSINIYIINNIKGTSFYNTIRRAMDCLSKHRYTNEFINKNKFTKGFSNNITDNLLDGASVQTETALHTYLDGSTGKLVLFSWKTVTNWYDVLNSLLVLILCEYSIDLQMDLPKTIFSFSTRCNLPR